MSEGGGPLERAYFFGMYGKFGMQRCDVKHVSDIDMTEVSDVCANSVLIRVVRNASIFWNKNLIVFFEISSELMEERFEGIGIFF